MNKEEFVKQYLKLLSEAVGGCNIQYGGCPCRSCFYDYAGRTLKLTDKNATALWRITLILRGDYTQEQIEEYEKAEQKEREAKKAHKKK